MANLTFRAVTNGYDSSQTTGTISATVPTGTTLNDLEIIWFQSGILSPAAAPTHTTPAGWTLGGTSTGSLAAGVVNVRLSLFYRLAPSTPAAASLVASANSILEYTREAYSDPDTTTPFGQVTFGTGANATSVTVTAMTTARANSLIDLFIAQGVAQSCTPDASMTERADNATGGFSVASTVQAAQGTTGTKTSTFPTAADSVWGFAEFYSAAAAGSSGTLAKTNANDTSAASGTTTVVGTLAKTNANDTSAASGTTTVRGTLARTNANDTSAAAGTTTVLGTLARTNANDTLSASGSVGSSISGTLATTNANDTLAAAGTTTVVGSLARTNATDTSAAAGTTTVTGSLARTNANDTAAASGAAGTVSGTVATTNANDTASAVGAAGGGGAGGGGKERRRYQIKINEQLYEGSKEAIEQIARELAIRAAQEAQDAVPVVAEVVVPSRKRKPAITAATQNASDVQAAYRKALEQERMRLQDEDDEEALIALLT